MHRPGIIAASLLLAIAGASCSSDDSASDDETTTTTVAAADGESGGEGTGGSEGSESEEPDVCVNDLTIVNADAEDGLPDGAWEPEMVLAEKGPHPDNTVDYDSSLNVAISGFELEDDPQFGLGIPVGPPDAPDGTQFYSFSLQLPEGTTLEAGQSFIDQLEYEEGGEYDGEINFNAFYNGAERVIIGDPIVTITEITDEEVCGEISTATDTDLQSFAGIEGTFVAERLQYLDSLDEDS